MPRPDPLDRDPGWGITPGRLLLLLVPGFSARAAQQSGDGLLITRQIFVAFVSALVLFQVVLLLIGTTPGDTNPALAFGFLAVGFVNVFVIGRFAESKAKLDCSDAKALAGSYQTRFFLRVAFAESAALLGFVSFFVTNLAWTYPASLVAAAFGFARLAPTARNLDRDEEDLRNRGCGLSLIAALRAGRDGQGPDAKVRRA